MRKRAGIGAIQKKKADAEKFRRVFHWSVFGKVTCNFQSSLIRKNVFLKSIILGCFLLNSHTFLVEFYGDTQSHH